MVKKKKSDEDKKEETERETHSKREGKHKKESKHQEHETHSERKIKIPWKGPNLFAISLIIGIVIGVALMGIIFENFTSVTGNTGKVLSKEEASNKAMNFISENLLPQGVTAKVTAVEPVQGQDLYKLSINISSGQRTQTAESYMTKDGTLLFPSAVPMTEAFAETGSEEEKTQGEQQAQEIPTAEKPKVDLYVMSFCPFGNKAEDTMKPVYELLGNKVDWGIHFIVSVSGDSVQSLHGQKEVKEDMREACVLDNNGVGKWFDFATYVNDNCGSSGSCWKEAAKNASLDTEKIQNCVKKRGLELMKEHAKASNEAGATGSPTLIINGVKSKVVYQYGNSEAYKQTICSAFTESAKPEACSEKLSATTTSSGGGCR